MTSRGKTFATVVATAVLTLLLVGCEITFTPPSNPFASATPMTADPDYADGPQQSGLVSSSDPDYFVLTVPSGLSEPLLYVDVTADGPLRIDLYSSATTRILTSTSPDHFGTPTSPAGLVASKAGDVGPQQVPRTVCVGVCLATENELDTYYLKVSTGAPSLVSYQIHAYDAPFSDTEEPANDDCTTGPFVGEGAIVTGAIETVGDADCIETSETVNAVSAEFTGDSTLLSLLVRVERVSDGSLITAFTIDASSGIVTRTFANQFVYVSVAASDELAGAYGGSSYYVEFPAP